MSMFYCMDIMCRVPALYITHVSDLTIRMASSSKTPVSDSQDQGLSSKSLEFRNITLDSKVRASMEEMRQTRILCDVTLVAGNVEIPAHRIVLASSSDYFWSMFTINLKEKESSRIPIKNVEPKILTLLVDYCYTSKIMITQDNVGNIFTASKMFQFSKVTEACSKFIKNQIQPDNCLGIKALAKVYDDTDLISSFTDSYIFKHFAEVVKNEEFLELDKEDLFNFIASDKIEMESEDQVFDCILSWIKRDRDSRSQYFPDFMKNVRFPFLSSDFLATKVQNDPVMMEFIGKDTITQGSLCSKPRQYLPNTMLVIGGWNGSNILQSVECFDFKVNQWSALCEMPDSRSYCGGAVVRDKVYVVGGRDRNGVSNSVCMYDPSMNTWTSSIPSMQSEREGLGVAVLNDCIYAVGGRNREEGSLNTAEVLDMTEGGTQEWRNISSMNTRRWGVGVAAMNGRLYAVGGWDGRQRLSSVESYDPERNVWSNIADLSVPRGGAGVAVVDGVLYCVGGWSSTGAVKTVEKYNEDTNTWSLVAEMNHSRSYPGVISHRGRLYTVGGYDGNSSLSSVEMYDPQTNTWTLVADMEGGRDGPAVALIHRPRTY